MKRYTDASGKIVQDDPAAIARFRALIGENEFTWGPVVKIHEVGPYVIVEARERVSEGRTVTNQIHPTECFFHAYVEYASLPVAIHGDYVLKAKKKYDDTHTSYDSLDEALAGVTAYRHDGPSSRAAGYFIKAIS